MELGKLEKVDLRNAWKNEATDFTTWLSREENLNLLSDEIGVNIKLVESESPIGGFSSDIFAEEENTGRKIIIENQLETTNHTHLGQILTYASGKDAKIMIWIVKDVRDEHKQAVDWLNEHTDEEINFFAIKMELWKIGNSDPAPKFQIVSKPNDWAKTIKKAVKSGELSQLALQKIDFLNNFIDYCKEKNSFLKLGRSQPSTPAYYSIPIGTSEGWIAIKLNTGKNILKTDLYITNKDLFFTLKEEYKELIEKEIGEELVWDELPQYKGATIGNSIEFNIDNKGKWKEYFDWIKDKSEKFQDVFGRKYISFAKADINSKKEILEDIRMESEENR